MAESRAGGDFLFNSWALVRPRLRLHYDNLPWVFPHGQRSRLVAPLFFLLSNKEEKVIVLRPLSPFLGSKCLCSMCVCESFCYRDECMNQPFSKYVKQWLAEVYGFGAFSCHQLTSPQTHFVLRHRGNRASLYPSPPFGEHLHPSWLSFCALCPCWLQATTILLKKSFFPQHSLHPPLPWPLASHKPQSAPGHRNSPAQRSPEVALLCLDPCVHW